VQGTGGGILASTGPDSTGNGGSISISNPQSLKIQGGAQVSASTEGTGKGGIVDLTARKVVLDSQGQISAKTAGSGDAGDITIKATENLLLSEAGTGLFSTTTSGSAGNGGNISVFTAKDIKVRSSAEISVDSQGTGTGGNIELAADNLSLDNQARISAETFSTDGGNITLTLADLLLLSGGSQISTTAGTADAGGDGGNITINTDFIVAEGNSDITANAFLGRGGNVDITTQGIFGLEFRENLTPLGDITASSQFGLSGTVVINNPNVDPSSGLINLPEPKDDPSDRVIVGCAASEGNSFTLTGRGGLPADPVAPIRGQTLLSDFRDFTPNPQNNVTGQPAPSPRSTTRVAPTPSLPQPSAQKVRPPIVRATGWRVNKRGTVELIAASSQETAFKGYPNCRDLELDR
jgi:large exoprotein involved in heme utilization and adhesion